MSENVVAVGPGSLNVHPLWHISIMSTNALEGECLPDGNENLQRRIAFLQGSQARVERPVRCSRRSDLEILRVNHSESKVQMSVYPSRDEFWRKSVAASLHTPTFVVTHDTAKATRIAARWGLDFLVAAEFFSQATVAPIRATDAERTPFDLSKLCSVVTRIAV